MRLFTLTVEERRVVRQRIAAPDPAAAMALARRGLGRRDRILGCDETGIDPDQDAAQDALSWLLDRPFLPLPGHQLAAPVRSWIGWTRGNPDRGNAILATAGLRLGPDGRLAVGSATTIPTLGWWTQGTIWAGGGLTAALRAMPGAELTNLTFAGRRARAVRVPIAAATPQLIEDAA